MIAPQSPTLPVFVPIEPVPRADMPSKRLPPVAAIQANHVILMNESPYRHGGNQNFLYLNGLSEVTQRVMNCDDQVRKLLWSQLVVLNVAAGDHRRGMWVGLFGIHDHPFASIMVNDHVGPKGNRLKVSQSPLEQLPALKEGTARF